MNTKFDPECRPGAIRSGFVPGRQPQWPAV